MRNAFVVLVSLCIRLVSGFIVPSGIEELDDNHAFLADNHGNESDEDKTTSLHEGTGFIVLPFHTHNERNINLETNKNRIKENELYEQDTTKHNNVNERSFIYINQKYKTPIVNQLYSSHDIRRESYKPMVAQETDNFNQYPVKENPRISTTSYVRTKQKSKKQNNFFEKPDQPIETKGLYFPPASNQNTNKVMMPDKKHELSPNIPHIDVTEEVDNGQQKFVELLKSPILRKTLDNKETVAWAIPDHLPNFKPYNKNLHMPHVPVDPRKFSKKQYDNLVLPSPFEYHKGRNQFNYSPDEIYRVTETNVKNVMSKNNDSESTKIMDRYLKKPLEDQVTNERLFEKSNNCSYSNCVMKASKHLNGRIKGVTECKCGQRLNLLKQRESARLKDRVPITHAVTPSTEINILVNTQRSLEIADYGDMFADEMNFKKLIEE